MLKVAIICKSLLKGGAEKQALFLAKSLTERDINVCLINLCYSKTDPEYLKFIKDNSIKYCPVRGSYLTKLVKVQRILRVENIQVLLSYLTFANFITGISRLINKKIKTVGGIRNEKLPVHKFMFERFIHNHLNDFTIFNNYSARDQFIDKGFRPDKIMVIQNAIETDNYAAYKTKQYDGLIRIISVGRFVKQKDYVTALNSFSNLVKNTGKRNFEYYIIGYGPLEQEIRSLAKNLDVDKFVKILINPPNIHSLLRECDIFLSTSLFEGVSNSIMEAMIAGLPVVATDVGDNKYLIDNGYNGFLIPCKNVDQIVEKLEVLSESEAKRKEFGINSRKKIEIGFSKEKMVDSYLSFFSDVIRLY